MIKVNGHTAGIKFVGGGGDFSDILLFDNGEWYQTDKMTMEVEKGSISDGKLEFEYIGSGTGICGISTETLNDTANNTIIVYGKNTSQVTLTFQYGQSTVGVNVNDIIGQGTGRLNFQTLSVPADGDFKLVVSAQNVGTFFGAYANGNFTFEISRVLIV